MDIHAVQNVARCQLTQKATKKERIKARSFSTTAVRIVVKHFAALLTFETFKEKEMKSNMRGAIITYRTIYDSVMCIEEKIQDISWALDDLSFHWSDKNAMREEYEVFSQVNQAFNGFKKSLEIALNVTDENPEGTLLPEEVEYFEGVTVEGVPFRIYFKD